MYLTTIPVVVGDLGKYGLLKLKTCPLYHENLLLQNLMTCIPRLLNIFSASDIMEAVRGRLHSYGMNAI